MNCKYLSRSPTKPRPRKPLHRRPLAWINGLLLLGLAVFWIFFRPLPTVGGGEPDSSVATALKSRVYASVGRDDELGFTRIDPANPGGWLLAFRETPQSLETYQSQVQSRPTSQRRAIVLQPIGAMSAADARLLEELRLYAQDFFQLPSRIERPVPLPPTHQPQGEAMLRGSQFHVGLVLSQVLQPRLPSDAAIYFGVTNADLWSPQLNFVFGLGDDRSRTGAMSLARLRPSFWRHKTSAGDESLILKRACRVLSHECGHVLGLWHCVFYKCVMNGSNSLLEADAQPLELCPVCHRKLLWSIGFDGAKRYDNVRGFLGAHGFGPEAAWEVQRLGRWKRIATSEQVR